MWAVPLPPGVNPIAAKYISYHIKKCVALWKPKILQTYCNKTTCTVAASRRVICHDASQVVSVCFLIHGSQIYWATLKSFGFLKLPSSNSKCAIHREWHCTETAKASKDLCHTGKLVDGDLSCKDSRLASRAPTATRNPSPWRYTLFLSSLKTKAWYSARTGRDCCCVGPKRTDKERKKNVRWPYNMWQAKQRFILGYFWRSEERRREVFNYFRISVESWKTVWENWICCKKKKKKERKKKRYKYEEICMYHLQTDQQ